MHDDYKKELPKRKQLRLRYFDYNNPGSYFITICTNKRQCFFSKIVGAIHESPENPNPVGAIQESPVEQESAEIQLTEWGMIVEKIINNLPKHLNAKIDQYVIMPNHIHMIIVVTDLQSNEPHIGAIRESPLRNYPGERAIRESPLQETSRRERSVISKVVGFIKMNISKEIHNEYGDVEVWQRGFYDHIIRNRKDYDLHVKYIYENPMRWYNDELYDENQFSTDFLAVIK